MSHCFSYFPFASLFAVLFPMGTHASSFHTRHQTIGTAILAAISFVNKKNGTQSTYLHHLPQTKTTKEDLALWNSSILSALTTSDFLVTCINGRRFFIFTDGVNDELVDTQYARRLINCLFHTYQKTSSASTLHLAKKETPARIVPEYERGYKQGLALFFRRYRHDDVFKAQMDSVHSFFMNRKQTNKTKAQLADSINQNNHQFLLRKFGYGYIATRKLPSSRVGHTTQYQLVLLHTYVYNYK